MECRLRPTGFSYGMQKANLLRLTIIDCVLYWIIRGQTERIPFIGLSFSSFSGGAAFERG